jgi:Concanavalin A-like lectin/glucanases superfamily
MFQVKRNPQLKPQAGTRINTGSPFTQYAGGFYLCGESGNLMDSTGNNLPGIATSSTTVQGAFGYSAIGLNGASSEITIQLGGNNRFKNLPITMWAWVKIGTATNPGPIFSKSVDNGNTGFCFGLSTSSIVFITVQSTNDGTLRALLPSSVTSSTWHQIGFTWNGVSLTSSLTPVSIFVDGISLTLSSVQTGSGSQTDVDTFALNVGWNNWPTDASSLQGLPTKFFKGAIDHFGWDYRFYGSSDIWDLYHRPFSRFGGGGDVLWPVIAYKSGSSTTLTFDQYHPYSVLSLNYGNDNTAFEFVTTVLPDKGFPLETLSAETVETQVNSEILVGEYSDRTLPIENIGNAAKDTVLPFESVANEIIDKILPQEIIGVQNKDTFLAPEIIYDALKDNSLPVESLAQQGLDKLPPYEFTSGTLLTMDDLLPYEILATCKKDLQVPCESLEQTICDRLQPSEIMALTVANYTIYEEFLAAQQSDALLLQENMINASVDKILPFENTGTTQLANDKLLPLEITGSLQSDETSPYEFLAQIINDRNFPLENLAQLRRDANTGFEIICGILSDKNLPYECLTVSASLTADRLLQFEFVAGSQIDRAINLEFTGGAAITTLGSVMLVNAPEYNVALSDTALFNVSLSNSRLEYNVTMSDTSLYNVTLSDENLDNISMTNI